MFDRVQALTSSTQFPNDELVSPRMFLESGARPCRKRGYYVSSPRSVINRLKATAIELVLIAILMAGFIIAALSALDLLEMLGW